MGKNALALAALLALASPAAAVDFSAPLIDGDGAQICTAETRPCPPDRVLTLGAAVRNALYTTYPDEQNVSGDDKFRRAELAATTRADRDVRLSAEEVTLVKRLVAKLYGPLVVHAVWTLVDPSTRKEETKQ